MNKGFVGVPACQHSGSRPGGLVEQRQIQHGFDALGTAPGAVKSMPAAKQSRGIVFALQQDARRVCQVICPLDLCQIPGFTAQGAMPFVAWHVEPCHAALPVVVDEIPYGCLHASGSCSMATWSMMAHSIRFLNNSQP